MLSFFFISFIQLKESNHNMFNSKELFSSMARALGFSRGVASSCPIMGILTVNFPAGTKSSCVQWSYCTSRMSSQPQLRYKKHIMIQLKSC